MKFRMVLILFALVTSLMSFAHTPAASQLEGFWSSYEAKVDLEVRVTSYGIKARRTDKGRWYYYDRKGSNRYQDHEGNRYYLDGNKQLVFKSKNGRQIIRFRRTDGDRYSRNDGSDRYDNYDPYENEGRSGRYPDYNRYERDDYRPRRNNDRYSSGRLSYRISPAKLVRSLEGNWQDRRTGRQISIVRKGKDFKANTYRGWTTFRQIRPGHFVDKKGNSFTLLKSGNMRYESRKSRLPMIYERSLRRSRR